MLKKNPSRKMVRTGSMAAVLALSAAVFAGCNDSDDNPVAVGNPANANLRVLHLSPEAPPVDVFLNQAATPAVTNLAFQKGTEYLPVAPADYRVDVSANGSSASQSVLSVPNLTLESDRSYTAVAYGTLASLRALALVDDASGLPAGNIRVRAIHTASAVGQVDIWNIPATGAPSPLYTDVDYGVAGGAMDLPAGSYTIGFDVDNDATPDVVFDLPALSAGTVANVFAVSEGSTVFLIAQLQDGTVARIDAK